MIFKEGDLVLCKVKKIEGTSVFVELENNVLGSIVLSEVSAGRIRNLRSFVSPNKLIVCKILRIAGNHLELSLRRVTAKERESVLENYKRENAFRKILKMIGEDSDKILSQIKKSQDISEFLDAAREKISLLEEFMSRKSAEKVFEIVKEKESKEKRVQKRIALKSSSEKGVAEIKEVLEFDKAEIHYLGSSIFSVAVIGQDFKEANSLMEIILKEIEARAKKKKMFFEIKKEK